ncbi:MAG: hypothetical protein KA319_04690, partial [Ferruginibacter sp.]|nr:hypothetical protein [Ferruginibacter sp.]
LYYFEKKGSRRWVFLYYWKSIAMQANLLNVKTIDKFLIEIGNKFMAKKKLDSSLVLNIIAYPEMSFRSQSRADFLLENIKNFYLERMNFSIENIYVETRIDGGDPKSIDWFISKPELK